MQHLILENRTYTGYEVAIPMMRKSEYNTEFWLIDRVESMRERADLLIIREVMQHWPNKDIDYVMRFMIKKYKYALLTNGHTDSTEPWIDINPGQWRLINLAIYPNMEKVLQINFGGSDKASLLYTNPSHK